MKIVMRILLLSIVLSLASCSSSLKHIKQQNNIYNLTTEQNLLDANYSSKIEDFYKTGLSGTFKGENNIKIYYKIFKHVNEKAAIVISSGRTEAAIKYKELIFDLYNNGYSIYISDHRGQGLSGRMVEDHDMGYIDDFQFYIDDLKNFYDNFVTKTKHNNIFLLAHSMGGAIGLTYIEQYPKDFTAAAFSSPMWGLPIPTCGAVKVLETDKPKYALGQIIYMDDSVKFEDNHLTYSKIRYQRMLKAFNETVEARVGGASYRWVGKSCKQFKIMYKNLNEIQIPVEVFSAKDDAVVAISSHANFVKKMKDLDKNVHAYLVPNAMHELFIEKDVSRINTLTSILNFYASFSKIASQPVRMQKPQIIYKTKKNYSQNVPIQMNKERTKITGFPAPSDLKINGELQTPIALDQDYFYDRRGISINTVFIKMTYEEYSKLKKAPSTDELMNMIIEKNPMVELYYCPDLKQGADVKAMNILIKDNFSECKKVSNIK